MITEGRFKPSPFRKGLQYSVRGDQYFNNAKDRIYSEFYSATLKHQKLLRRGRWRSPNNGADRLPNRLFRGRLGP